MEDIEASNCVKRNQKYVQRQVGNCEKVYTLTATWRFVQGVQHGEGSRYDAMLKKSRSTTSDMVGLEWSWVGSKDPRDKLLNGKVCDWVDQ